MNNVITSEAQLIELGSRADACNAGLKRGFAHLTLIAEFYRSQKKMPPLVEGAGAVGQT
jgi:hypothetical protein